VYSISIGNAGEMVVGGKGFDYGDSTSVAVIIYYVSGTSYTWQMKLPAYDYVKATAYSNND
jgi:hypothetical protein